jgi:hypothetical protein
VASPKPSWKFNKAFAAEVTALLILPLLVFWLMRFAPINQDRFIDAYFYTGYINDFQDLMARYGITYYSVRFGFIVPAQFFTYFLGPEGGYFAFRYVLALIAGIPFYYAVKRNFSQPAAIFAVAGMLTSTYFARTLLWDYVDAAGVPFLIAAVCLFLLDERPVLWRDTLAGACAAMSIHCNFFVIALIGIFGAVWFFFSLLYRHPLLGLTKRCASVAAGALLVTALGYLYYWHALGKPTDIFSITVSMSNSMLHGGAEPWRTPGATWITTKIHVLTPIVLVLCCIAVIQWRRTSFAGCVVVSFGAAITAFYYVEQFLLDSNILQLFYYFSYLIPAIFLMLAFLGQTLWERTKGRPYVFIGLGLTALLAQWMLPAFDRWVLSSLTVSGWLLIGAGMVTAMFVATRELRSPPIRSVLPWMALVLLGGGFTAGLVDYGPLVRQGPVAAKREMEVYRVALQFANAVPKQAEHPGVIRFWYRNRSEDSLNSIQSMFLWGYSRLSSASLEDPGLPYLGDFEMQILRDPQLRYLGLLGESQEELSKGLAALTQKAIRFEPEEYRELASGDYRVYFQIVELVHGPSAASR